MSAKRRHKGRAADRPAAASPAPAQPATAGRLVSMRPLLVIAAGIAVLTILTFGEVRQFDFVHYDDFQFVVENPNIATGLTAHNLRWVLHHPYAGTGGPLTWLSHIVDVEIFGLEAGPHHVTSVVIHTLGALMLLYVLHAATGSTYRSGLVAALFAVHPLHVESVAWIAQRKDVLSGFFFFATLAAYVGYVRRGGAWKYGAVLALFALGLMSKPMVVTLPFVLLLMDWWPLQRIDIERLGSRLRPLLLEKVPLLVLGGVTLWLTLLEQRELGAVATLDTISLGSRAANAVISYAAYIYKMIWPVGLIPYYPLRVVTPGHTIAAAVALLIALATAALLVARRAPYITVGWLWYVGMLVPVIGIVQVGGHAMADRSTYLPLIGLFIALSWGAHRVQAKWSLPRPLAVAGAIVLVAICAVTARNQTAHWRDGIALWEHTVRVDPENARAHSNLGVALAAANRTSEAIRAYETSLRLQPGVPQTLTNLGLALETSGQMGAAADRYAESLRSQPDQLKPRMHLAALFADSGRVDLATEHYQEAVRWHPDEVLARVNLAVGLGQSGRPAEALPHMLEAVRLEPGSAQWRYFAGVMMIESGRRTEAVGMLESALRIDPVHAGAQEALLTLRTIR